MWTLDSGCTSHYAISEDLLTNCTDLIPPCTVSTADGNKLPITKVGTAFIHGDNNTVWTLPDVKLVPDFTHNLLSVAKLTRHEGITVAFDQDCARILKDGNTVITAKQHNNLFIIYPSLPTSESATVTQNTAYTATTRSEQRKKQTSDLIHDRLGHLSWYTVKKMAKADALIGLDKAAVLNLTANLSGAHKLTATEICEACVLGKSHRQQFKAHSLKPPATYPLDRISADLSGPVMVQGQEKLVDLIGQQCYLSLIVDEYSRFMSGKILSTKDEAAAHLMQWITQAENQTKQKLRHFLSDTGGEYTDLTLVNYLNQKGVKIERTSIHTPQHNGRAERANRTIFEMARTMLFKASLGTAFWGLAVLTSIYILNHRITSHNSKQTPMELWTGNKPSMSHFRVFGCDALVHPTQDPAKLKKMEPRALRCIFIGYSQQTERGYIFYDPAQNKIIVRRDAVFDESSFTMDRNPLRGEGELDRRILDSAIAFNQILYDDYHEEERKEEVGLRRSQRRINPVPRPNLIDPDNLYYEDLEDAFIASSTEDDPLTYAEAMNRDDADKWKKAMEEEMKALAINNTWDLVRLPRGAHAIGSKWVFKRKLKSDGSIERYKARFCAKGFSQEEGIDYKETFAPVVKYKSLRIILGLAAELDYELKQMDVVTAFLNANIKETVYMKQPEGFETGDQDMVCKLKKTLYGTKQAPHEWNEELNGFILSLGFRRCVSDTCVYVKKSNTGYPMLLSIFVDDIVTAYATEDEKEWEDYKEKFTRKFQMKDLGDVEWILGMRVRRNREKRELKLDQQQYLQKVLETYKMTTSNPVATPEQQGLKLSKSDCPTTDKEKHDMKGVPYRSAVGSLLYAAIGTRPDIAHAVNEVSKFIQDPGMIHWQAIKRILRYLKGTMEIGLVFKGRATRTVSFKEKTNINVQAYSDADWAGDKDDRRSTTGFIVKVNGITVSWATKKQKTVALSSAEAEYIAIGATAQEIKWVTHFLLEVFTSDTYMSTQIYTDNQAAMAISKNDLYHERTKHIDLRHHFIRDDIKRGLYGITWISTTEQMADIFTKGVGRVQFIHLREKVMN